MKGVLDNVNVINSDVVHHCNHTLFDIKKQTPARVHDKDVLDNRVGDPSRVYALIFTV